MTLKNLPIHLKIMILSFGIVLFSLLIGGITVVGNKFQGEEEKLGERGLMTGRTIANLPEVKQGLIKPEGWNIVNQAVEQMRSVNNVDYIVVLNMNRIRYSHPIDEQLGTLSSGKDEGPALAEHSYVTRAEGEMGTFVRSFVPIMNDNHVQIGVVIVGNELPSIWSILSSIRTEISVIALLTLAFGIAGSYLLAKHVKQQTFLMEPHEMASVLEERTAVFQAMHEGVIAVDRDDKLVIFNNKAREILGISSEMEWELLESFFSSHAISGYLLRKTEKFNETVRIDDRLIILNRIPIKVDEQYAGTMIVFQDRTDVTKMAEELTGVKAFVDALRVQNHEYMNKLHTIAGLIQLNQNDRALEYVFHMTDEQDKLSKYILDRIGNYSIAGMITSKIRRGNELGIKVTLNEESKLETLPEMVNEHDLTKILGNLIENALNALKGVTDRKKHINVTIKQNADECKIEVTDNGIGIPESIQRFIFEKGFTTKDKDGSGLGLYIINETVSKAAGSVNIQSTINEGTKVVIMLPMKKGG